VNGQIKALSFFDHLLLGNISCKVMQNPVFSLTFCQFIVAKRKIEQQPK